MLFSGLSLCCFLCCGKGVFGSSSMGDFFLAAAATISLANWVAWRISPTVSPTNIAGNDIRRHSSATFAGNFPPGDFLGVPFLILEFECSVQMTKLNNKEQEKLSKKEFFY